MALWLVLILPNVVHIRSRSRIGPLLHVVEYLDILRAAARHHCRRLKMLAGHLYIAYLSVINGVKLLLVREADTIKYRQVVILERLVMIAAHRRRRADSEASFHV